MPAIRLARSAVALMLMSLATALSAADLPRRPIPFVKQCEVGPDSVSVASVCIPAAVDELAPAVAALRAGLALSKVPEASEGIPVRLALGPVSFPAIESAHRAALERQGYRLQVAPGGIDIQATDPQGVFHGVQTLLQLLDGVSSLPVLEILDWPDLAERMVLIDSARQNENADYYRRVIDFLARYKINRLHWHLTDDEILALYQEDYPTLMHPQAWRVEQIRALVDYARQRYIAVIPEIESLGHARVFTRHPDFRDFLHQTTAAKSTNSWAGTPVPGFTNVLCPASPRTYEYLERMYARAAEAFPYPLLHVGCDEVDATQCARCAQAFPEDSFAGWIKRHLLRCLDLTARHDRKMALWGDMLLSHREVVDCLPPDQVVIYDWHYRREVDPETAAFFQQRGFAVIGCPALFCHPRMILPDDENFANIAAFAKVARQLDLPGLDTTIWTPTRYMSDVLWPGIAFAAAQAWSGGNFDEDAFYVGFVRDFFGSPDGAAFAAAWRDACQMRWHLPEFNTACWVDEAGVRSAQELAARRAEEIESFLARLTSVEQALARLAPGVRRNEIAWRAIMQSVATRAYTMKHLLASREVQRDGVWNARLLAELDAGCREALSWIEANFDRNRYPDDANKDGGYLAEQNLIYRFRQMHRFHEALLQQDAALRPAGEPPATGEATSRPARP